MRSVFVKRSSVAGWLALLAASAGAVRSVDLLWRRMESSATGDARWIWSTDDVRSPRPARFAATRSFVLDEDVPSARAKIFVDRAYRFSLDGRPIGGGAMKPGDPFDSLELGRLGRGTHVFSIEAESPTGIGGILFALDVPGRGRDALVSDASWTIAGRPAFVWGEPPMYPWGFPHPRQ